MPVRSTTAHPAGTAAHQLAEGPVWDGARDRLLWVDIPRGRVHEGRLVGDRVVATGQHVVPGTAGAAVPTADGGLLVAGRRTLWLIAADGSRRAGPAVIPDDRDSRLNDGACDPAGRFLVGSMALDGRTGGEALHRIAADGAVGVVQDGLTLSNGLGWAPDGTVLHHVDSEEGVIWSRAYDPASGAVGPRRVLRTVDDGAPDGLCVAADGTVWVAVWGAGEVRALDPSTGDVIAVVTVPAPHTSSAAFVGPALDRLLITTAREGLDDAALAAHPRSGELFIADVGTTGAATVPWAGRAGGDAVDDDPMSTPGPDGDRGPRIP